MSPPDWFLSRAFLSLDFARLILKEESSSFSFGDNVFHILVEREMKSSEGCGTMSVVSFLVDMVYISWSDSGVLSLRILSVSMNVWYVYRFSNANMLCFLNKGFVCSFWKKSTLRHWYWYGQCSYTRFYFSAVIHAFIQCSYTRFYFVANLCLRYQ